MMMMVHHDDRGRPFSPDQRRDGGADGPTCNNRPSTTANNNSIAYDVVVGVSGASADSVTTSSGGSVLRGLQPFQYNISNTSTHHNHNTTAAALRSPGGMATTAALGFPFTNQQWKELERQAMIYKYMMASLPVPRDLLFPTASASQPPLRGGGFNLRLSSSTDPEPGRCKRTDGKKWRCSRDVAPDQKYCERHMHRGRPRSRKHVEIHANQTTAAATTTTTAVKKARRDNNNQAVLPPTLLSPSSAINKSNGYPTQFLGAPVQSFHQSPMFMEKPDRENRSVQWRMRNEQDSSSDVQWHDLMQQQSKTELSSKIPYFEAAHCSVFGQRGEEESFLNLNSYGNFNAAAGDQNHQHNGGDCNLFLNPDVVTMENPLLEETPRSFIDAWSKTVIDENRDGSIPNSSGQLSPSSLTLSMGGYNSINDEMGQTQMSLGGSNGVKQQVSKWLTPTSWVSSPPGGPLAEVLKPTTSAASNPSSPITTTTTTTGNNGEFSSPSCVLNKTLASFSDSSGNSSPKTETVSLWLSQSKA